MGSIGPDFANDLNQKLHTNLYFTSTQGTLFPRKMIRGRHFLACEDHKLSLNGCEQTCLPPYPMFWSSYLLQIFLGTMSRGCTASGKSLPFFQWMKRLESEASSHFFKTSLSAEWELVVWQADGSFLVFSAPTAAAPTGDYGAFDGSYLKGQPLAAFQ